MDARAAPLRPGCSEDPDFSGPRVVYAEGCTAPSKRLHGMGVAFKQIPYQIEGLRRRARLASRS